jgi:uncharacterized membrane-anchored protein
MEAIPMKNISRRQAALLISFALAACPAARALTREETVNQMRALGWQHGPANASLGTKATIAVPDDSGFLSEADSSKFLELTGNLPSPGTNILASRSWWATFDFENSGYVKDEEKIDAEELLKGIKATDGPANEERRKRGLPELHTDGWYIQPHYDEATHHLEWALRLHASDNPAPVINYTVRMLGRTGYERVVLVSSPSELDADVRAFKETLKGFNFKTGERYSEFKQDDRVAEFGLAALVAGGAAAVAAKTGFWKVTLAFLAASWKLVLAGVAAVFMAIGKIFKRKQPQ